MKINKKYPACPVAPEDGTGVNPVCPPGGLILSKTRLSKTRLFYLTKQTVQYKNAVQN
jgi:hypothetical protein